MRLMAALALLGLSCEPLQDPSRCPAACPPACADACLPSGYCRSVRWQATASPPVERGVGADLAVALGGLPPDADVGLSLHGVFDLVERGQSTPWDYWILLARPESAAAEAPVVDLSAFNAVDFPVVGDWTGAARTDASGALLERFSFRRCQGRLGRDGDGECLVLPQTTLTAVVLDPSPWTAAPACR